MLCSVISAAQRSKCAVLCTAFYCALHNCFVLSTAFLRIAPLLASVFALYSNCVMMSFVQQTRVSLVLCYVPLQADDTVH